MVTVQELARLLYVHPNTVRHWSDEGLLRSYRIGPRRDRRFSWEDIRQFLQEWGKSTNPGNRHRGKVLIVVDDYLIQRLLKDVIERQDCEATSVESGEKALEELEKQDFDLILLDLAVHGLDGVDLLWAIKAKSKNAVVALVIGYGDDQIALEALSLGPLVLIVKPLESADIIGILDLAMGARQYRGIPT